MLWFTRLSLLVKAQQLDAANAEMAAFGHFDAADLYYEFHPELYGNRRGSMVPFSFRLLAAALPAHNHKINEAQDKTCHLLATVRKIIANVDTFLDASCTPQEKEDALLLWADREVVVIHSLVNIALLKKDYHNAVRLLHQQLRGASRPSAPLFSILGRTYLQLGDVVRAQRAFNAAADLRDGSRGRDAVASLMDAALVAIAQNSFSEAYGHYQQALVRDPDNALVRIASFIH
nr:EOG090X0439 [Sida crystallina]